MNNYEELSLSDRKINTRAMDNIIEPGYIQLLSLSL